ncbi:hypothetical protein M2454_000855 [Aequitasia blattaphilus]|uniref:C39 family peptidase n=1 Tax=Aequitasia blattaphilus TaxID=2949332 RepID=A0ABT1EA31_9FIRM|nr:C39 family peptidase [Aequitasia blattaphilus]MCP1102536.1 C39 family peptidase [Aequitasia blattaphilus]MCR8615176.1 C39 family peptidase [Aequitasia blattaphilus]
MCLKKRLILGVLLILTCTLIPAQRSLAPIASAPRQEYIIPLHAHSQLNPSWSNYLYGGVDPLATHGCGPAALATAVSSLTTYELLPPEAADWSAANGFFSANLGSIHGLIPEGGKHYGLKVQLLPHLTPDAIRLALDSDKILILLMGPGDFTATGHFIVLHGYLKDGLFKIFDPASSRRSDIGWPADTLLQQLSTTAYSGGPVWVLSE